MSEKQKDNSISYAHVALKTAIKKTLTYSIPPLLKDKVFIGSIVEVPLRNRKKKEIAFVLQIDNQKPSFVCQDILDVPDSEIRIHKISIQVAFKIASYYGANIGESLNLFAPPKKTHLKSIDLKKESSDKKDFLKLSQEQEIAFNTIKKSILGEKKVFLLHGVTGSGKTEIYKHLIKETLKNKQSVIITVPEINLTEQIIEHFSNCFEDKLSIIHSRLTNKQRYNEWYKIYKDAFSVVLGARSALFSPINNLGLIILDEEHESSYKSSTNPRYLSRHVAFMLSRLHKACLVLGTASPSVETYFAAQEKKIELLTLYQRQARYSEKNIQIIDMRKEKSFISEVLFQKIKEKLEKKEQILLFLNRRGFSSLWICRTCGQFMECENCEVNLTYHQVNEILKCHFCGLEKKKNLICTSCQSEEMFDLGYGTQKVEEELKNFFLKAKIERLDLDNTKEIGNSKKILKKFREAKIDILIGTQMIAKGFHFPNLTLVGILRADMSLHLPDIRSNEKTFALLLQLSGRAGRSAKQGDVLIQTYNPKEALFEYIKNEDYISFYNSEIALRKRKNYPPFSYMIRLVLRGEDENNVKKQILSIYKDLKKHLSFFNYKKSTIKIIEPNSCFFKKLHKKYRWQIIIQIPMDFKDIYLEIKKLILEKESQWSKAKNYLEIDFYPYQFL